MGDKVMVNKENVRIGIDVMRKVIDEKRAFNMRNWQTLDTDPPQPVLMEEDIKRSEEELTACGTAACFAGWLSVDRRFLAQGGSVGSQGEPRFGFRVASAAVAKFLGITYEEAAGLCAVSSVHASEYYEKSRCEITPEDVIEQLERYL